MNKNVCTAKANVWTMPVVSLLVILESVMLEMGTSESGKDDVVDASVQSGTKHGTARKQMLANYGQV